MAVTKLRKPILVGGIGLSVALWWWDNWHKSMLEVGQGTVLVTISVGIGLWLLQQQLRHIPSYNLNLAPIKREEAEQAIAATETILTNLVTEAPHQDISALQQQLSQLPEELERRELQLVITGGRGVGKTQLKQVLSDSNFNLIETEALFTDLTNQDENATKIGLAADLVLLLINGDLTESEWQFLQNLRTSRQRVLLVFNKQDQYVAEERALILQQVKQKVSAILTNTDVIGIAALPNQIKVRQHQDDGTVKEWLEQPKTEISTLHNQLENILKQESESLVFATVWRKAINLQTEAKNILNQIRKERALPIIEQYQWLAAGTAFVNPVAALDLLATAAINTQMLLDLGDIYQQKLCLAQAQNASGTIGKLMVKLGLVELSTQTIGSLLKSNAITYVAGGAVQGISAAYLTRLAGLSLIAYFQEQEISANTDTGFNLDRLGTKLQEIFNHNQRSAFLQSFVKQAILQLPTDSSQKVETVAS